MNALQCLFSLFRTSDFSKVCSECELSMWQKSVKIPHVIYHLIDLVYWSNQSYLYTYTMKGGLGRAEHVWAKKSKAAKIKQTGRRGGC